MRILIADQNRSFRAEFVELITHCHPNWQIAEVDDAVELDTRMCGSRFDVVFLDLHLPGLGARLDLGAMRDQYLGTKFVGLGDTNDSATIVRCFEDGLGGYIARSSTGMRLINTLKVIGIPDLFVSTGTAVVARSPQQPALPLSAPTMAATVAAPAMAQREAAPASHPLTARQADVLNLLAEGRSTKDIARRLGLAVPTVKTHLAAVYRQLGARNRLQAVVKASSLAATQRPSGTTLPRSPSPSPMFERHFAAG